MPKDQKFTKTAFKKQAQVVSDILRMNPILNDDEKASLNETVGVLTWLNQLQLHWAGGGKGIPDQIQAQLFDSRTPEKLAAPVQG
jgi:hypothetical protein